MSKLIQISSTKNSITTVNAKLVWKALNGIFTIYKRETTSIPALKFTIKKQLCSELNEMRVRPLDTYVSIDGKTNKPMQVLVQPDYGDHPLVAGPRYAQDDIHLRIANPLEQHMSGVVLIGINDGREHIERIQKSRLTNFYRLKGVLGYATDTGHKSGKIIEHSKFGHVQRNVIDGLCASMQAAHQKRMFELHGFHIQSQAAYELAIKGPIRPLNTNVPMIYSIKCMSFDSPEFVIEVVCINENEHYLITLINEIGLNLHTNATCTQIQCFRYGIFDIDRALLSKHWKLQNILINMEQCEEILLKNPTTMYPADPSLVEGND